MKNPKHIFADKVFIENDDDLIFVIDKIREAQSRRIILITSEHSLLTSSEINLKLLARQCAKYGKSVIIVTKNELARNKTNETLIPALQKIEEITPALWELVEQNMTKLNEEREETKKELIKSRKESGYEDIPVQVLNHPKSEENDTYPEEKVITKHEIKRIEPKVITVGEFDICVGGDITKLDDFVRKIAPIKNNIEIENSVNEQRKEETGIDKKVFNVEIPSHKGGERTVNPIQSKATPTNLSISKPRQSSHSFTGMDVGKHTYTPKNNRRQRGGDSISPLKFLSPIVTSLKNNPKLLRYLIALIAIIVVWLFMSTKLSKASIMLVPASESISISENLTADPDTFSVNLAEKRIPLKKITKNRDGSESGIVSTQRETGDKAKGVVDFLNKTDKDIVLNSGTKVTTLNGNLTFTLDEKITIPKRISEATPSSYENAPITAESYGEKYNTSSVDVKIDGYNTISELSGRIYRPTRGGSTKLAKVVSQEEVDALKNKMLDNLKILLRSDIKSLLGDEDILIDGLEESSEITFEFNPPVGTEASTFEITKLDISLSMFVVDQNDVDMVANELIVSSVQDGKEVEMDSKQAATISDQKILEGGKVGFKISKDAQVDATIDTDTIFAQIKGKSIPEATVVLKSNTAIKKFEIKTSPFFIPNFMRAIPDDKAKVEFVQQ